MTAQLGYLCSLLFKNPRTLQHAPYKRSLPPRSLLPQHSTARSFSTPLIPCPRSLVRPRPQPGPVHPRPPQRIRNCPRKALQK